MEMITESNHEAPYIELNLESLYNYNVTPNIKAQSEKCTIFIIDKAMQESWKNYRNPLVVNINRAWDSIEEGILSAAKGNIPYKRISNSIHTINKKEKHRTNLHEDTITVSWLYRKLKKSISIPQTLRARGEIERINKQIRAINERNSTNIQQLRIIDLTNDRSWLQDLKGWWHILNRKWKQKMEADKLREIKKFIDLCCQKIQNEQDKMLDSLLDRPISKIQLDHLLDQNKAELVNTPSEVKNSTRDFFKVQYKKKCTDLKNMLIKWKKIYKPQLWINENIYKDLNKEI
ncbi:15976_t:CDS:2, partial [Gigaspora margarita]